MRRMIFAAIALAIPTLASADAVQDAMKERQDYMKSFGKSMGMLAGMAKGEVDYDAANAQAAADTINEVANTDLSALWIEGSSSEDFPGDSRALPAVWENPEQFAEVFSKLAPAAATLQAQAGQGQAEMAQALGGVGSVCSECHKTYQAEKK